MEDALEVGVVVDLAEFGFDGGEGLDDEAAKIGERGGCARRNSAGSDEFPEARQGDIDVVGGAEVGVESSEFGSERIGSRVDEFLVEKAAFAFGVEEAEIRVRFGDGHLAVASVGKRELAGEDTGTRNALFGHWKNLGIGN